MSAINFKVGDEVQISDESGYRYQGYQSFDQDGEKMRGVISPNENDWYTVTWDNGDQNSYQDEDLEPYGATKSSHGFELNELVIVCEDGFGFGKSEVGKEFIIVEFGDYGGDPGVKLRDAETNTIHPNSHFNGFVGIKSIKKMESKPEPEKNVTFEVNGQKFKYSLRSTHYSNVGNNDIIFSELKVDKHSFCSEAYDYKADEGSWPEWRDCDNEAPIKIVKAIREKIKQMESQPKTQTHKFQVGDTVVGNSKATDRYSVTQTGWCGIVTEVYSDCFMAEGPRGGGTHNFELHYEYFDLAKSEREQPELPKRKFEVGDKVTYKYQKDLLGSCYRYGGPCQGGYVGTIKSIERDDSLNVTTESGLVYHMSPDEFVEYDGVAIKPADEAFLAEANRRYPIGTMYKELNAVGEVTGAECTADEPAMWVIRGESIEVGYGYVYAKGRWAEVVPETKYVVTQRIPSPSGGIYDSTPERTDISAAVIRNVWVDPSTKQLPDAQTPIIMSRSKNKNKIKVL